MKRILRPSRQVIEFAQQLAPVPRRAIKQALENLREDQGDIVALEGSLAGYHRLRIGRHRVIFQYAGDGVIEAVFIEERALVHEVFEAELVRKLSQ
jgi:mRNA-degrading endonuclease RelE of RelBE toxin-antitoxin system